MDKTTHSAMQRDLKNGGNLSAFGSLWDLLQQIPAAKMHAAAQYLDQNILPRMEAKGQAGSADYNEFKKIVEALLYAVRVVDRFEFMLVKMQQQKQILDYYQQLAATYEIELMKFTTMQDLLNTETARHYTGALAQKATTKQKRNANIHAMDPGAKDQAQQGQVKKDQETNAREDLPAGQPAASGEGSQVPGSVDILPGSTRDGHTAETNAGS